MKLIARQLRLIFLDLWRSRASLFLTFFCLVLGFWSLIISLGLRDSQDLLVSSKAREILTGDIQLSSTRPFAASELDQFRKLFQPRSESFETDLMANLRFQDNSILVELKAVTASFPLLGQVLLSGQKRAKFDELEADTIWLADELRRQFGLKVGDEIDLGQKRFRIGDWIEADISLRRGATGFAPRAYIRKSDLIATELIQPGSQIQYRVTALLVNPKLADAAGEQLEDWPADVIVRNPNDAVNGIKRGIDFVERYFALVTLLLMILGFVSGFYLLQIFLRHRALVFALELLYGIPVKVVAFGAALQTFLLVGAAWALSLGLTKSGFAILNPYLSEILPAGARLVLGWPSVLISLGIVLLNTLTFSIPFTFRLRKMDPDVLLNQSEPTLPLGRPIQELAPYGLALLSYVVVAPLLLDSMRLALVMFGVFFVLSLFSAFGLPWLAARYGRRNRSKGLSRLAWLGMASPRLLNILIWVAVSWSACLTATIPNLLAFARDELGTPQRTELPQIFVINLREQDQEGLRAEVSKLGGELRHVSPLILGRLLKRNGEPLNEGRLARFPVRLTYRDRLSDSEKIVAGNDLGVSAKGDGVPGISVDKDFAERNDLKLGDHLEFEVAGLPLFAMIQNFRDVKWSSFQPNFFFQFSKGVLEDFPKSYIGVIYGIPEASAFQTQSQISARFPTLSLLNLATTIDRLTEIASKLLWPILAVSAAGLLAILLLVGALGVHLWQERKGERTLLFWLGALPRQVTTIYILETSLLTLSALTLGGALGWILSSVSGYVLLGRWMVPGQWLPFLIVGCFSYLLCVGPVFMRDTRVPN